MTVEGYLAADAVSDRPVEYFDGEVFFADEGPPLHEAQSDPATSPAHAALLARLTLRLRSLLSGTSYRLFAGLSMLPGLSPSPLAITSGQDIDVTEPKVIFEIVSTGKNDCYGTRFKLYRQLASLEEYVLLSREEPQVEVFRRAAGQWTLVTFEGPDATLVLESLHIQIPLGELYAQLS